MYYKFKIGNLSKTQKDPTERCLMLIAKVLPHLLMTQSEYRDSYIEVVCKMLDTRGGLYRVQFQGTYYNETIHLSYIRIKVINIFHNNKGFEVVLDYLKQSEWLGAYKLKVLLNAFNDVKINDSIFVSFRDTIAQSVSTLSEDIMRKENSDQLVGLFKQLNSSGLSANSWLEYILKCFKCSSVVVKLAGWDLVQDLVEDAFNTRPYGYEYEVRNAGYKTIDGIYTLLPETYPPDRGDVPKYRCVLQACSLY